MAELTDEDVGLGAPTVAGQFAPVPRQPTPVATAPVARELTDEEVFTPVARLPAPNAAGGVPSVEPPPGSPLANPSFWGRLGANAREAFDSTLAGETVNRIQSGQVAQTTADDITRAVQEAEARGSQAGLETYANGQVSPYAQIPLDQLRAMAKQSADEAARRRPIYDAKRAGRQQEYEAMPPWTAAEGIGGKVSAGVAALLGQLAGGAPSPENLVGGPGGRVVRGVGEHVLPYLARRVAPGMAEGAIAGAVADPVVQEGRISRNEQEGFEPGQLAQSVLIGAGAGGAFRLAGAAFDALRGTLARRRGVDPATITPDKVTIDDVREAASVDPDLAAHLQANGIDLNDPRAAVLQERLAARRAAEAQRPEAGALPTEETLAAINREAERRQAEAAGVQEAGEPPPPVVGADQKTRARPFVASPEGTIDPSATNLKPRDQISHPILVDKAGEAFVGDEGALQGRTKAPILQQSQTPRLPAPGRHTLTEEEAYRLRRDAEAGRTARTETPDRLRSEEGRLPQTRDQIAEQRAAGEGFTLADRQRERAGVDVRDTQTAGRPAGLDDSPMVRVDMAADGQPVRVLDVTDRGVIVEPYDPRTGTVTGDRYLTDPKGLQDVRYSPEPRMAQDFVDRARGPKPPELPREAIGPIQREPNQTYRGTTVIGERGVDTPPPAAPPTTTPPQPRGPQYEVPAQPRRLSAAEARREPQLVPEERASAPQESFAARRDQARETVKVPFGADRTASSRRLADETAQMSAYEGDGGRSAVDAIAHDVGSDIPHDAVVRYYRRADGETPREAAERAVDEWAHAEERAAIQQYDAVSREFDENPIPSDRVGYYETAGDRADSLDREAATDFGRYHEPPRGPESRAERPDNLGETFGGRTNEGRSEDGTGATPATGEAGRRSGGEGNGPGRGGEAPPDGGSDAGRREAGRPTLDAGPDGGKQTVIPGAERLSDREFAERRMSQPDRGGNAPPPDGGLFDEGARNQSDLFDSSRLSSNPFVDPQAWKAIGEMLTITPAWARDVRRLWGDLKDTWSNMDRGKKVSWLRHQGVMGDLFRAWQYSNDGQLRAIAKQYKSPTIKAVADMLFAPADVGRGGTVTRTYQEGVEMRTQGNLNRLARALQDFRDKPSDLEQIRRLVQNPGTIRPGSKIHDAAAAVRKLLDDEWQYLKDAGVDVGNIKGYFPRVVDAMAVVKDPAGFLAAAKAQYLRDRIAKNSREAEEMANAWLASVELGMAGAKKDGTDFVILGGTPNANFAKERVFSESIERDAANPLRRFYVKDPIDALTLHFQRTARRAEWARRFGDDLGKWKELKQKIIDEGNGQALRDVVDLIGSATGVTRAHVSNVGRNGLAFLRTWAALKLLPHATITSLSEIAMPSIRSGNPARLLGDIVRTTAAWTHVGLKEDRGIAEDIGAIAAHMGDSILGRRYHALESGSKLQQGIMNNFFRRSGLEGLTTAQRTVAVNSARVFLRRLALDVVDDRARKNSSLSYLRELGIENPDAFARWVAAEPNAKPSRQTLQGDGAMEQAYQTALLRFVNQSVMNPNTSTRPKWSNHPVGSMIFMLNSFNYAFTKNVLGRAGSSIAEGLTKPGYSLADRAQLLAPAAMLPVLAAIQWGLDAPRRSALGTTASNKEEDPAAQFLRVWGRAGLTGTLDPYINMRAGARYDRDAATALAGPAFGSVANALDAVLKFDVRNSDNTNTAERKLADTFYQMVLAPGVALGAGVLPPLFGAGALFAGTAGGAREAFTEAVAGPKDSGRRGHGPPARPHRPSRPGR